MNQKVIKQGTRPTLLTGILFCMLGVFAMVAPVFVGAALVVVIGILLLIAASAQGFQTWQAANWSERWPHLILAILLGLAGCSLVTEPLHGLVLFTLVLAVFFVAGGIWKIIASFSFRPATGWVGLLVSGILGMVLGLIIWSQWPVSGLWAVGILVGIDLLSTGLALVAIAMTIRSVARDVG